jgi:hypothetical protein
MPPSRVQEMVNAPEAPVHVHSIAGLLLCTGFAGGTGHAIPN